MYGDAKMMHMRTTLNIDEQLLRQASKLTGVTEKTALVRMGLEALVSRESARRLADLGGTERSLSPTAGRCRLTGSPWSILVM